MSQVTIRNRLTQHMFDFDQAQSDIDVRYTNTNHKINTDRPWLKFTINMGQQQVSSIASNPLIRQDGMIDIQIFVGTNTDTLEGYTIADLLIDHFVYAGVEDVVINPPTITSTPRENYYQINVKFPFTYL